MAFGRWSSLHGVLLSIVLPHFVIVVGISRHLLALIVKIIIYFTILIARLHVTISIFVWHLGDHVNTLALYLLILS